LHSIGVQQWLGGFGEGCAGVEVELAVELDDPYGAVAFGVDVDWSLPSLPLMCSFRVPA